MSGFAAILQTDGQPVDRGDLERMVASMARRGPDGSAVWTGGPVGLGHCMLCTTPESLKETLPVTNAAGNLVITADARIDNRSELIEKLALPGRTPQEITDSELILGAYEKWGEECVQHLLGDFAFVVWDAARQALFCARDHFGVKPFHYYRSERFFACASEVRALLSLKQVPRRINEGRIADYLVTQLEGIDKTSTFYQDIFRLPPAHRLTVGREGVSLSKYWSLDPSREIRYRTDDEYVEAFREVFTEAIRCRLRSHAPVGVMLSGGIDSASILGVAKGLQAGNGHHPIHTFSGLSADEKSCVESQCIRKILAEGGVLAHTVRPDQLEPFLPDLEYALFNADDPFLHTLILPQVLYSAAHKQGVKVLLDGIDGDLVASTSAHLAFLLRAGKWKTALQEAKGLSYFYRQRYSPLELLYQGARAAFAPDWMRRLRRRVTGKSSLRRAMKDTIVSPDFAGRVKLLERLDDLSEHGSGAGLKTLSERHARSLDHPYIPVALERYDRAGALNSVEPRHPFLDRRLVEFCLALPWEQKVQGGWSKILLRRVVVRLVPEEVRWRRGWEHVGWEFAGAFMAREEEMLRATICEDLDDIGRYADPAAVREACKLHSVGPDDLDARLWEAGTLALWLSRQEASVEPALEGILSESVQ